jgi:hypothetical protein
MELKRILIVANRSATGSDLIEEVRDRARYDDAYFTLVVPASPAPDRWVWDPSAEAEGARQRLAEALILLGATGARVDGLIGDADPYAAVNDVLSKETYDEVILSTLPASGSSWARNGLARRIERSWCIPVRQVSERERRDERHSSRRFGPPFPAPAA